jgi:hypothetical protein
VALAKRGDGDFGGAYPGISAPDPRARRDVITTASFAPRPTFRSTIRSIEINGRSVNVPQNAPGRNPSNRQICAGWVERRDWARIKSGADDVE